MGIICEEYFVKVEGPPDNGHRNPKGIYKIDVFDEQESACRDIGAILREAIQTIPFLSENMPRFSLRLFSKEGDEIRATRSRSSNECDINIYCQRAANYPQSIS